MCKVKDPSVNTNEERFGNNSEEIQLPKFKRNQTGHEPDPRLLDVAGKKEHDFHRRESGKIRGKITEKVDI